MIHAVGSVYEAGDDYDEELLTGAYQNSLRRAMETGLKTVSIPSISTGAFNYPMRLAAPVAMRALVEFLEAEPHDLELVRLVLYPHEVPEAYSIYSRALTALLESRQPAP